MIHGPAKACVVDALRAELRRISPRCIGLERLATSVHSLICDVRDALAYLRDLGEVTHDAHQGWRYVPQWEAEQRRRIEEARARRIAGR